MGTLQALLAELSGLKKPRGFVNRHVRRLLGMRPKPPPKYRILVMMATNMPESLDEALLRPGRIDRIYKVGYPSKEGRKRTYEGYLAKVRHDAHRRRRRQAGDDLARTRPAPRSRTSSTRRSINAIRDGREAITWPDISRPSTSRSTACPTTSSTSSASATRSPIHEACHAVAVVPTERQHSTIDVATIERRGDVGGFVSSIPLEDQMFTLEVASARPTS